jgi:EXS family
MDGQDIFTVPSIAVSFPLPFHIFVLVGLAILCWATNLHGLDIAGIDVVGAMDLRTDGANPLPAHHSLVKHSSNLSVHYRALYRICTVYCLLGFVSWAVYRHATHGDLLLMDTFGYIPGITALLALSILLCPYNVLHKTERRKFLQLVFPDCELTFTHPCLCEVLLADVCCLLRTVLSFSATWFWPISSRPSPKSSEMFGFHCGC